MKVALRRSLAVAALAAGATGSLIALPASPASATGVYVCYSSVKTVDNTNGITGHTTVYAPVPGSVATSPSSCPPGTVALGVG